MAAISVSRIPLHIREKIVRLKEGGISQRLIHRRLQLEDAVKVSTVSISKFLARYRRTGSCLDARTKRPHLRILKEEHVRFIDEQMRRDPETTASDLTRLLRTRFGILASQPTVKRARSTLGWRMTRPKYCQMVCIMYHYLLSYDLQCNRTTSPLLALSWPMPIKND